MPTQSWQHLLFLSLWHVSNSSSSTAPPPLQAVKYRRTISAVGIPPRSIKANNEDDVVEPWEVTNGAKGHNSTARHIVYVGGVDIDGKTPKDTRTTKQLEALANYVRDFRRRFPSVQIVGHNELAAKACPSFDVQEWIKTI